MKKYSFIIPVYNRGEELEELLETISSQTHKNFDVIVVDDGSDSPCQNITNKFEDKLDVKYIFQENSGPGMARNKALEYSNSEWLIFLDSDCLLPDNYLEIVNTNINKYQFDCFGGPDKAHNSFNTIQKAIGYAMSSTLTTGGIRGGKEKLDKFYPRSFNLGVKRSVFIDLKGFSNMRFGEDLDFSMRLLSKGYKTMLIKNAFVYHKRRNNFKSFFKQVFNSGIARINLEYQHPKTLKFVHTLPTMFILTHILLLLCAVFNLAFLLLLLLFPIIVFIDSFYKIKDIKSAFYSILASYTQLFGYGLGFIYAFYNRKILKKGEFHSFTKNFYK